MSHLWSSIKGELRCVFCDAPFNVDAGPCPGEEN